jgi:hypothetical protein
VSAPMFNQTVGLPDLTTATPPVYANVAHTSFTPYDFRITFSLLTLPHDQAPGPARGPDVISLTPRAVAQVVLPAAAMDSVVELLRAELGRFVEQFGPPQPTLTQPTSRA